MFKIDFCYVKMKSRLYQVFLKTPNFYTVTADVIELNNRKKISKNVVYFQPEDNHETRTVKSEKSFTKITGSDTS